MRVGVRLAGFVVALLLVFGLGFGIGRAVGPLDVNGNGPQAGDEQHETRDMEVAG